MGHRARSSHRRGAGAILRGAAHRDVRRVHIPQPDELVFISWYPCGEVFRSGCAYYRGRGKVFYFSPGHETFPIYYQPEIRQVLANAVRWAAPVKVVGFRDLKQAPNAKTPLEPVTIE